MFDSVFNDLARVCSTGKCVEFKRGLARSYLARLHLTSWSHSSYINYAYSIQRAMCQNVVGCTLPERMYIASNMSITP